MGLSVSHAPEIVCWLLLPGASEPRLADATGQEFK